MADINGTSGADTLNGTAGADVIHGLGGNDSLNGQGGADIVYGDEGDDTLTSSVNPRDDLHGGDGNDHFLVSQQAYMWGDAGTDTFTVFGLGHQSRILDFQMGAAGDRLDLVSFADTNTSWNGIGNPFALGYLTLAQVGDDVFIGIDSNGGGDHSFPFLYLMGVDLIDLEAVNFAGPSAILDQFDTSGADNLTGTAALDVFHLGAGNDDVAGGFGVDTAVYAGGMAGYSVSMVDGAWVVTDIDAGNGNDGVDTLHDVEELRFADGALHLVPALPLSDFNPADGLANSGGGAIAAGRSGGFVTAWLNGGQVLYRVYGEDGAATGPAADAFGFAATGPLAIDYFADGSFVIVGQQFTGGFSPLARLFDADGTPKGSAFPTTSSVQSPGEFVVEVLPDDSFLVAWAAGPNDNRHLFVRHYAPDGTALAAVVDLGLYGSGSYAFDLVGLVDSNFFLARHGAGLVTGQAYATDGSEVGQLVVFNTTSAGAFGGISVDRLADGRLVVVYNEDNVNVGRIFDPAGATLGAEFAISSNDFGPRLPDVAALDDGDFVAVWEDNGFNGRQAYAQRFDADAARIGNQILVSTGDAQTAPSVVAMPGGSWAAIWQDAMGATGHIGAATFGPPAIVGTDGDDTINGGAADDTIDGGAGNDFIDAGSGDDIVLGGAGRDDIIGGLGKDELHGGDDTDFVFDTEGDNDALYGDGGDDLLGYGAILSDAVSDALLDGGDGDDEIHYFAYNFDDLGTIVGGDGNDRISSAGGDHITIDAGAGADLVEITNLGTRYDISLGAGSDRLWLNGFQDYFADSAGLVVTDFAAGDAGDVLSPVQYLTTVTLGWDRTGNPFALGFLQVIQRGADAVVRLDRDGAAGNAYGFADLAVLQNVTAAALTAHNLGFAPNGSAAAGGTITGTAARDLLSGASGDDLVLGLGDNDRLFGGAGDDRLEGGDGFDTLDGELGDDQLYGGADTDFMGDSLGGDDQLFGEGGRDLIQVSRQLAGTPASTVLIDGGDDNDTLIYLATGANGDNVTVIGGAGEDLIRVLGGGAVTIDGGDGPEIVTIDVTAASYAITLGPSQVDSDIVRLQYTSAAITSFTVLDFFGDMLQMRSFLASALSGWNGIANPFGTGHLVLAQSGADAVILIDRDGGGDSFALLGRLADVDAAQLTSVNLDGFAPGPIAFAGTAGDDSIVGTSGADTMIGLAGNDLYRVDNAGDVVIETAGEGTDRVNTSLASYTLGDNVENLSGNGVAQTLTGNAGANLLHGGGGVDTLIGLGGNDIYFTDVAATQAIETAGGGSDQLYTSVSYVLTPGSEIELLSTNDTAGTGAINLTGNGYNQTILGNQGANFIHGGGGTDVLIGYGGNDIYFTDVATTQALEAGGGGSDQLYTSVSYVLTAGSEIELLSTNNTAGTGALNLTGNGFGQTLVGNEGVNVLHGGGGVDTLIGYGGNDIYFTDVAATQVNEGMGGGNDQVYTSVSYVLNGSEVEFLSTNNTAGTGAINLTGNGYDQTLVGNEGVNVLHGGGGTDTLIGYGGNDIFFTDVAATQVNEGVGGGDDQVYTSVSYVLNGSEIELLSTNNTAGTGAINLTGNGYNQTILGNQGANVLHGGGGTDVLVGYGGNDIYFTDVAATQVLEAASGGSDQLYTSVSYTLTAGSEVELLSTSSTAGTGAITLTGNELAQTLLGNAGANTLDGKSGSDTLLGFGGADTFAFTTALGAGNVDTIGDFAHGIDKIALAQSVFTGLGLGALNANAFVVGTAAGDADDRIIYDSATGQLFFDADGLGGQAQVLFATLQGPPTLTASDFTVI